MDSILTLVANIPNPILYAISPFLAIALLLAGTRLVTTWTYHRGLRQFDSSPHGGGKIITPPRIPYTIPWLGSSRDFVQRSPGAFWADLFSWHPRSTGVCTLLVGGRNMHIVYNPTTVQAIFRSKAMSRDIFDYDLFLTVFGMTKEEADQAMATKHLEEILNTKYLINHQKVNELTDTFINVLDDVLSKDAAQIVDKSEIGLYDWLRDRMFTASTTSLYGSHLLEMYPTFCKDFFDFDTEFLMFFFRFPNFLLKDAVERRARIKKNLQRWSEEMLRRSGGKPIDPEGPVWEEYYGSRLGRARQICYKDRGLNWNSATVLDLGIIFGLSSNAIPATAWMLFQLVQPGNSKLLSRALAEIKASQKEDGSLDVARLVAQPVLQAVWTETLRLYMDVLVSRNLPQDVVIPLDDSGKNHVQLRKGDNVMCPSFLGHKDEQVWSTDTAPSHVFDPERFIVKDPKTGEEFFSQNKNAGKFFPFGGGKTICPGRFFAKQEAIGALALVLSRFDFDVKGYVDVDGQKTTNFPGMPKAFPGSGALTPGGDIKVKVRRRVW